MSLFSWGRAGCDSRRGLLSYLGIMMHSHSEYTGAFSTSDYIAIWTQHGHPHFRICHQYSTWVILDFLIPTSAFSCTFVNISALVSPVWEVLVPSELVSKFAWTLCFSAGFSCTPQTYRTIPQQFNQSIIKLIFCSSMFWNIQYGTFRTWCKLQLYCGLYLFEIHF